MIDIEMIFVYIILVGIPLSLLYIAKQRIKQSKELAKGQIEDDCDINLVPRIVEGDRKNVVRVCIVAKPHGDARKKMTFPKHFSETVKENMKIYSKEEYYKAFINDGSVTYEYLIIDKTGKEPIQHSGVTTNYEDIHKITKEIEEKSLRQ